MINEYGEKVELLFNDRIKVERIESYSNITDFMKDSLDEFVYLLEGSAKLEIDNKIYKLNKNEHIFIPKNTIHRVIETSFDCKWLCIFIGELL